MFRRIIVVSLLLFACGCASTSGPQHIATVPIVAAHDILSLVQDTERKMVCGQTTAPPIGQCVPEDKHKEISSKLVEAFGYDQEVARVVRALPPDAIIPSNVTDLMAKITELIKTVMNLIPASNPKTQLSTKIGG